MRAMQKHATRKQESHTKLENFVEYFFNSNCNQEMKVSAEISHICTKMFPFKFSGNIKDL